MRAAARFAAAAAAALLLLAGAKARAVPAVDEVTLARPEGPRHYLRAGPSEGRHPLVILLHGHGGTAKQLLGRERSAAPLSSWLAIAEREDLVVAAPDGLNGADGRPGWNDCRADADNNPRSDDVGFIGALVDRELASGADPARVYVIGMSNGGMMAFRLAIELAPRLAAFAAVSASMAADSRCAAPRQPLSALVISGTADPVVPWAGGPVKVLSSKSRGAVIAVEQAVQRWRELGGLPAAPQVQELPHRDPNDPTRATRLLWGGNPAGVQVELMRIEGGGHVEPSASQRLGRLYLSFVGPQNADFETAEEAWAFFRPKRAPGRGAN